MKFLRRELEIRKATQRFLQKQKHPDTNMIKQLTGEIFELQRIILTKLQVQPVLARA